MCRKDWVIQILHGIQPLCLITRFGDSIVLRCWNIKHTFQGNALASARRQVVKGFRPDPCKAVLCDLKLATGCMS